MPLVPIDTRTLAEHRIFLPSEHNPNDVSAGAAYRMLRTRLLHRIRTNNWTTVAVTSPGVGEGKSVSTINLALNMARERSSEVFLIDLDLRSPSVCGYLGVTPPRELTTYFTGEVPASEVFFSVGVDRLAIAGNIAATENSSELVASAKLDELVAYINSIASNPVILIDLPPALVTDEALIVAPRVDAMVLVAAEGRTRRDSLMRARQLLAEFPLAGVILNCSSEKFGTEDYYGYGYRYSNKTP